LDLAFKSSLWKAVLLKGHQQSISAVRFVCERCRVLLLFILLADICHYQTNQWLAIDVRLITDRTMSRMMVKPTNISTAQFLWSLWGAGRCPPCSDEQGSRRSGSCL